MFFCRSLVCVHLPDSKNMYSIELDEKIHPLLKKIVEGIRLELNISIDPHEFAEKFMYHIMIYDKQASL